MTKIIIPAGVDARTVLGEPLLTAAEAAAAFRVKPATVARWARAGKLTDVRTLGGRHRYLEAEIRGLLAAAGAGERR
jgi:excisionase family DNA binding protein